MGARRATTGCEVDERTILDCAAHQARGRRRGRARRRRRQVLNLGHTVGHAIETATGYARYRHGEAVGLGLLAALRLSGPSDLRAQVRELLLARGLPVTLGDVPSMSSRSCGRPRATRSASARASRSCSLQAPGEVRTAVRSPTRPARRRRRVELMAPPDRDLTTTRAARDRVRARRPKRSRFGLH